MNLTIRPYKPSDAAVITSWLKSEYLMRQWCADRYEHYPVTPDDMNSYHERYIDGQRSCAMTMIDGDDIVGYITLRTPADDPTEQRLGFVIVDDSQRGCGLGKALVGLAVKYAFETLGAAKVSFGVFENNPSAIHCYEAAGFKRVATPMKESYFCMGETWNCIEMELTAASGLKEMTLEELWQLFPIVLTPHQPQWSSWAKEEIENLAVLLSEYSPVINHIGSTAISGIQAKPIIDILVEINPDIDWQRIKAEMEAAGYICMSVSGNRMSFNKGYTPNGYAERVFHIHFHAIGDNDEIRFRDYLNCHPTAAREYESLKLSLLPRYRNDRDGYTEAKSAFIKKIISKSGSNRSIVLWLCITIAVMFVMPFSVARFASECSGMALCMILFLVINPVYSLILGAVCGKDIRRMWNLPLVSAIAFLAGTWLFFDIKEIWFLIYAAIYLMLGWIAMLGSKYLIKQHKIYE